MIARCAPLALALALLAAPASAALPRFQTSAPGALTVTGNTLGLSGSASTGLPSNNHAVAVFIAADPAATRTGWPAGVTADWRANGSTAVLDLPPGATVLYAELVWGGSGGGDDPDGDPIALALDTPVAFTTPTTSHSVAPDPATALDPDDAAGYYARSADVTALVDGPGVYAVGGVPASLDGDQDAAGWTLFVAYADPASPTRSLTLFSIGTRVSQNNSATASVAGLCTPPQTDGLAARVLVSAIEGDASLSGDSLRFAHRENALGPDATRLAGPRNPVDNFFASQIATGQGALDLRGSFGTTNHAPGSNVVGARQGWDITGVDASAQLQPSQHEAWLRATSEGDAYVLLAAAVQIDLDAPRFANLETAVTTTPTVTAVGAAPVTVAVALENAGGATASGVTLRLTAPLPAGLAYTPGSLRVDGALPPGGSVDAATALTVGVALPDLPAGEALTVTFALTATAVPSPRAVPLGAAIAYHHVDCNGVILPAEVATAPAVLTVAACGDGTRESVEACDDGDALGGDGCSAACTVEYGWVCDGPAGTAAHCRTICGDGKVVAGVEACDDGDQGDRDGCSPSCTVEYGWACSAPATGPSVCAATCGDGRWALGAEACDDGGALGGDGCSATCAVERGYGCVDPAPGTPGTPEAPDAACAATCGDGVIAVGAEACDDGDATGFDGCSAACAVEYAWTCTAPATGPSVCMAACGDGRWALGAEGCDDGDAAGLDGCSASCAVERGWACLDTAPGTPGSVAAPDAVCAATCGDGVRALGAEACDDGGAGGQDGCSSSCVVEYGWACAEDADGRSVCSHSCGDGAVAAGAEACDDGGTDILDGCSSGCQVEYGWQCSPPGVGPTFCASSCGDGKVAVGAEACDDGDGAGGDGCGADCRVEPGFGCSDPKPLVVGTVAAPDSVCQSQCGDGAFAAGVEACDDGNGASGDGCSPGCEVEGGWACAGAPGARSVCAASCGDGLVALGAEVCDDGNAVSGDGCAAGCRAVERGYRCPAGGGACATECGDGDVAGAEVCDDGDVAAGDGCAADCGALEPGYSCSTVRSSGPLADTVCSHVCGDGARAAAHEACDDGNAVGGDGCGAACGVEAGWRCEGPEGGRSACAPAACGDGVRVGGEACDDGNALGGDGCAADCAAVERGYGCEDPAPEGLGTAAAPDSLCATRCGDGVVAGEEACDDGGSEEGDGCPADCLAVDPGFSCAGEPSVCEAFCGDGEVAAPVEACDDHNMAPGDGCDAACAVEVGWRCDGGPSVCVQGCGNGIVAGRENCDDGNLAGGDGCSAECGMEAGWRCEGEPSACARDHDGDGVLDDGDGSGVAGDGPCVGGEVTGCDDNCLAVSNAEQGDGDGDGVGDACSAGWDGPRTEGGGGCGGGGAGVAAWAAALALAAGWRRRRGRRDSGE